MEQLLYERNTNYLTDMNAVIQDVNEYFDANKLVLINLLTSGRQSALCHGARSICITTLIHSLACKDYLKISKLSEYISTSCLVLTFTSILTEKLVVQAREQGYYVIKRVYYSEYDIDIATYIVTWSKRWYYLLNCINFLVERLLKW